MTELAYSTVDKSSWGPGEWQDEHDKIQWRDEATGLACLANRGPGGHWCGYVGVPPGHPAHGMDYDRVYDLFGDYDSDGYLDVHGGLTYAAECAHGPEESSICHVPEPGEPDNVWWLGFDCAHSGDLSPSHAARDRERYEATGDPLWRPIEAPWGPDRYRTLEYVRGQTTKLARQLAGVSNQESAAE